ncbi:DUF3237 domain-containing protein [Pseudomonas sp. Marseille-QA0892]
MTYRVYAVFALLLAVVVPTNAREPPRLVMEPLARFSVDLSGPVWELGEVGSQGQRRIIPITGGRFDGPGFKGQILNNGADWQIVDGAGTAIIDTRYLLQTDDGALVYLQTKGYRHGPAEVLARIAKGETVDPSLYYFRVTMQFETSDPKYTWLNGTVGIGSAVRQAKAVVYDAYVVK